jgi:predicted small lipoprotein YifL
MNKYDTIINAILVILILTIIVVILFGCHYKGCRYFEKFENNSQDDEEESKDEKKKKALLDNIKKDSGKDTSKKDKDNSLSSFEKTVLEGLSSGSLNTDGLAKLIKEEKFTNMNLDNIINYVEKVKGNV